MNKQYPPTLLIETWLELAKNKKFPEAQQSVIEKINLTFGSISEAELYLEKEKMKGLIQTSEWVEEALV